MKQLFVILFSLVIFIILGVLFAPVKSLASAPKTTLLQQPAVDEAVKTAFRKATQGGEAQILGFLIYAVEVEHIEYSQDGSAGLLYLVFRDSLTGEAIATEPGLSIAANTALADPTDADNWQIT